MRNAITFSGFVDVYNIEKEKIFGRNLYIKRFEEAWFTWKLKCWFSKLNERTIQNQYFTTIDIEKIIQINFCEFQNKFIQDWHIFHSKYCLSKNKLSCKAMRKTFDK
jgi:hypothetical protein